MRTDVISRLLRLTQLAVLVVIVLAVGVSQVQAQTTVAWWRFGDDPSDPNYGGITDGDWVQPTAGRTEISVDPDPGVPPEYIPGYDSSGNGNTLVAWDAGGAGHNYREDVASSTITGGSANGWSIQNEGAYPAAFTWSQQTSPTGTDLQTFTPSTWTIEATVRPTTVDGVFRTFIGREGNNVGDDPNSAPLYFQITNENQFRINYTDADGYTHLATSSGLNIYEGQWYHVAATNDGSNLSLYLDQFDGTGYQQVATLDLTASGSTNTAMIDPGLDANSETWGWTVGRGRYGTSTDPTADHTDRFFGNIDEVRITDGVLSTGSFLFAGQNLNHGPRLEVNRDTGEMTLTNLQASFDCVGYSITSASGAIDPTNWYSVAGNQDSAGDGSFDPNDAWTADPGTNEALTEYELIGDGGQLGVGGTQTSIPLGLADAWIASRYEDLSMSIDELMPDFSVKTYTIPVVFTGNGGESFVRADLNLDNSVDSDDWIVFRTNHLTDLSTLTAAQASVFGDLDGDLDNDFNDFRLFQADYDAANGAGAFVAMLAAVPEPSSVLLLLVGCLPFGLRRR